MKLKKMDRELVDFPGTDIPPMSSREMMLLGTILELIENTGSNILTMDQIFEGYTFSKKARFEFISRLVKNNVIRRTKHSANAHEYTPIPKDTLQDCAEGVRIYPNLTRAQKFEVKKSFMSR